MEHITSGSNGKIFNITQVFYIKDILLLENWGIFRNFQQ